MTVPPSDGEATPPPPPVPPTPPVAPPPPVPPVGVTSAPSNGTATAALICGILSIICSLGFVTGIPAIVLGISGRKKADQMGGTGSGQATAGLVIGLIGTILSILAIIFFIVVAATTETTAEKIEKRSNEISENLTNQAERNNTVAKKSHYTIDDKEIDDSGYGSFTFKAFIENEAPFKTGFQIDVKCTSDVGDSSTETAYSYSMAEGARKSFTAYFYFDDEATSAECSIDEVRYSY